MKITSKQVRRFLLVSVVVAVVYYGWEYHCVTRPMGQCGSLCEKRAYLLGELDGKDINGYLCIPQYRGYWK